MTNIVAVYHIRCSTCGQTIWLLETMLEQIIRNRLVSDTGDPFLTLVCSGCKTGFRYNYAEREFAVQIPEPESSTDRKYPTAFFFRAECVDNNCISLVQLTAIRDSGTKIADVIAEFAEWDLKEIVCENGHHLFFPDPEKSYESLH